LYSGTIKDKSNNKENINISVTKNNLINELKKKNNLKSRTRKIEKNVMKENEKENIVICRLFSYIRK